MDPVRPLGSAPLNGLFSAGSSAQSADSAPPLLSTFNALNLYQRECSTAAAEDRGMRPAPTTPATGSAYSPYSAHDAIGDTVVEAHRHGYNHREIAELTATIEQPLDCDHP